MITAYDLKGKPLVAYRRRRRRITKMTKSQRRKNRFPSGWDENKVRKVLAHYENQTEEEAAAEDEASFKRPSQTIMKVPRSLVPAVRELIALSKEH